MHVGAFKISGIVCSLSHALHSNVEAMEITRAEGTGRFLKRFDFIAREISSFVAGERRKNEAAKKRGKRPEQSPVSHMTFGLPIHFALWLPISDPSSPFLSLPAPIALSHFVFYIEKWRRSFALAPDGKLDEEFHFTG